MPLRFARPMLSVPTRLAHVATEEGVVFLDLERDRYFRLRSGLEQAFALALAMEAPGVDDPAADDVERLIALGVLERATTRTNGRTANVPRVASSIVSPNLLGKARPATILEAASSLFRARSKLKSGLAGTLANIAANPARSIAARDVDALRAACRDYLSARRFIPIEPVCLLDSVALLDFLGRRGLDADLVFGVIIRPFSAHCWLQIGDLGLNDELDNLIGRAPILVI